MAFFLIRSAMAHPSDALKHLSFNWFAIVMSLAGLALEAAGGDQETAD